MKTTWTWVIIGVLAVIGVGYLLLRPRKGAGTRGTAKPFHSRISSGTYSDPVLKLTVKKPASPDWEMTDNPESFRVPEDGKVVELRRNPKGKGSDRRFAAINIYVQDIPPGANDAMRIRELERLDKKAKPEAFRVLDEQPTTIAGQAMTRRVTVWDAKGRETKFVSVRCTLGARLYVLLAFTDTAHFDALLPEIEEVIASLRTQ